MALAGAVWSRGGRNVPLGCISLLQAWGGEVLEQVAGRPGARGRPLLGGGDSGGEGGQSHPGTRPRR